MCSTVCLSFLNSLAHFKRPSIFHVPSIMLALSQLSPLIHINSCPTSFKKKKKTTFESYSILLKTPPSLTTHRLLLTYQTCNHHLFVLTYEENKSRPKTTSPRESSFSFIKRCCFRVLFRCQSSWQISNAYSS